MSKNDGGPAFPHTVHMEGYDRVWAEGLSLRDWFAGQALASGLCPHNGYDHDKIAKWCADQADAMLEARK